MQAQHQQGCSRPAAPAHPLAVHINRRGRCSDVLRKPEAPKAAFNPAAAGGAPVAAAAVGSGAAVAPPAQLLALKEWAPTCAAIANGEQTVLLRKGGIKEPTFRPAAREFLLFPTSFHTDAQLLKPEAAQRYAAECGYDPKAQPVLPFATRAAVTGAWTTHDPAVLELLDELHVWAPGFLENRLRWRKTQPITVLELRAVRLPEPLLVAPQEDFWGCFSWVDISAAAAGSAAGGGSGQAEQQQLAAAAAAAAAAGVAGAPALDDAAFAARQALCRQQLGQLADLQELPPLTD